MCKRFNQIILLALLTITTNLSAEPSRAVTYLMTEETTLFDRGMDKLSSAFSVMSNMPFGNFTTTIRYDWDYDSIIIASTLAPNSQNAKNREEANEWCVETIKNMKLVLGVSSPPKLSLHDHSYMNKFFSHYRYTDNKKSIDPGKELDWITIMRANVSYNNNDKGNNYLTCESKLMDKTINIL